MAKDIYIDVRSSRTRVALVENGDMIEFNIERTRLHKIVGNIYKGKVCNVLKGMQAAFVDIGREKNGYLYVGDSLLDADVLNEDDTPSIPSVLTIKEGDEIMVQVVKEEIGSKGARLSTGISLPGRYLVFMPGVDYVGISRKIIDENKKCELISFVESLKVKSGGGFIIRTATELASKADIKKDAQFLINLWKQVQSNYDKSTVYENIYNDGNLIFRTLRDIYSTDIQHIYVNDTETYKYVKMILNNMIGGSKTKVELYNGADDMFSLLNLQHQIDGILKKKVCLENGAYLVIDKTEALTVIDVNSGKYVGSKNLEDTAYNTNIVASREIARQLRLRDIAGIIVIDFIDMHTEEHKQGVLNCLEECLKKDRIRCTVRGMSGLGLVEITRKKSQNEILAILTQECPYCGGNGYIDSNEYIIMKLKNDLQRALYASGINSALITANPVIKECLFSNKTLSDDFKEGLEDKTIYVLGDSLMHIKKYEIMLLEGKILDVPDNAKLMY